MQIIYLPPQLNYRGNHLGHKMLAQRKWRRPWTISYSLWVPLRESLIKKEAGVDHSPNERALKHSHEPGTCALVSSIMCVSLERFTEQPFAQRECVWLPVTVCDVKCRLH